MTIWVLPFSMVMVAANLNNGIAFWDHIDGFEHYVSMTSARRPLGGGSMPEPIEERLKCGQPDFHPFVCELKIIWY
jgi:hypothetical protein